MQIQVIEGIPYFHRQIAWHDAERHAAYQRLRAEIFVGQLRWDIPLTNGCERDRYDSQPSDIISIHGIYALKTTEFLLGGVRIFELQDWQQSMVMNEFSGLIPQSVLQDLKERHSCRDFLELSRFCVQRGFRYRPVSLVSENFAGFHCAIARDLVYASIYAQAEKSARWLALGIADFQYMKIMRRSGFVFDVLYEKLGPQGFALTIIDLVETIHSVLASGGVQRAKRMLALCSGCDWIETATLCR